MSSIKVVSLGCRLNLYESEQITHRAKQNNLSNVTIINSCAVTQEAVRQSRRAVRQAKKQNPSHKIILTGCAAKTPMPEADEVIDNNNKLNFFGAAKSFAPQNRTRALLKIQTGCDWDCTFCWTTKARGAARSLPMAGLIEEARFLFNADHLEITLTGVDIASYGKDLPAQPRLGDLLETLLSNTPAQLKFRLSSLDPAAIDDKLFALLASEDRVKPFIHLSAQSGDNIILKRMKRRHSREQMIGLCNNLSKHRPFTFGADIIAGFPTETNAQFQNSKDLVDDCSIIFAHIFPFSPRQGTKAAEMPQLDSKLVKARAHELREHANDKLETFLQNQIGTKQEFLAETSTHGRSDSNCQAIWQEELTKGVYHTMKILGTEGTKLIAAPA